VRETTAMPLPAAGDSDRLFGRILVALQLATREQIDQALAEQERAAGVGPRCRIGTILVARGAVSPEHVVQVLELQGKSLRVCAACDESFDIVAPSADPPAACPDCGATLYVPQVREMIRVQLGAEATQVLPAVRAGAAPGADTPTIVRAPEAHATLSAIASEAPSAPPYSGKPFGRYRLLEALSQGGMGVVWKAWDTDLKRIVALEQIREEKAGGPAISSAWRATSATVASSS